MEKSNLTFRRLEFDYIAQVMEIEKLSFPHPWSIESYAHELNNNELAHFFGLFDQQRLIAFAGYWLIIDEGHIANVAVHPDFRGKGFGELLMRRIMGICHSQGASVMTLEVRESNIAAQKLYTKLGFEATGLRPHYYDAPDEDALIMWVSF